MLLEVETLRRLALGYQKVSIQSEYHGCLLLVYDIIYFPRAMASFERANPFVQKRITNCTSSMLLSPPKNRLELQAVKHVNVLW